MKVSPPPGMVSRWPTRIRFGLVTWGLARSSAPSEMWLRAAMPLIVSPLRTV